MRRWNAIFSRIRGFCESHGFALLTVICVACIASAALWTGRKPAAGPSPTPPSSGQLASALLQQSLQDAATPTPLPTAQPILWQAPLSSYEIVQSFSGSVMVRSDTNGSWSVHHGADLAADEGAPVRAMASGVVKETGEGGLEGIWIAVSHTGGYVSRYSGLSLLGAFRPGDPVSTGQTIGFVGSTHVEESALGPHLHLQVLKDGNAVDPVSLFP